MWGKWKKGVWGCCRKIKTNHPHAHVRAYIHVTVTVTRLGPAQLDLALFRLQTLFPVNVSEMVHMQGIHLHHVWPSLPR